ncbi:hypothetical protein V5O48_003020 [Marasmius crinis-equi]|uniref:F-box domain-containing protein n=1 Tax=Marasmius crinis-equi TaxID=585013 RepID=A0ABR3FTZ3_9AGAR
MIAIFHACCAGNDITARGVCVPRPPATLVVICAVCGRWRDLAIDTPSLWATIKVNVLGSPRSASNIRRTAQLFIARSRHTLIHADIGYAPVDDPETDFFYMMVNSSHRWRSLTLKATFKASHKDAFDEIHNQLPTLKELSVTLVGIGPGEIGQPLLTAFETAPSLRFVDLDMKSVNAGISLPWSQISKFRIRQCHVHEVIAVFSRVPYADEISIEVLFQDDDLSDNRCITLPSLRRVVFELGTEPESAADEALNDILDNCTLPKLEAISITQMYPPSNPSWDVPWAATFIPQLILRSGCILTSISFCHIPIADIDLMSVLELTPSLATLDIIEGFPEAYYVGTRSRKNLSVTPQFLRRLSVQYGSLNRKNDSVNHEPIPILTPRLAGLSLEMFDSDLDLTSLVNMIVSRCPVDAEESRQVVRKHSTSQLYTPLTHIDIVIHSRKGASEFQELSELSCFRDLGVQINLKLVQELEEEE